MHVPPINNQNTIYSLDNRPIEQCCPLALEILKTIFAQLDIKSLCTASLVSREWYVISAHDDFWMAFASQFNVYSPNIKSKIRETRVKLDRVYSLLKKNIWSWNTSDFFCKFTTILFKDNVSKIEIQQMGLNWSMQHRITLTLSKVRQVYFNDANVSNIHIPEKVTFCITPEGFTFKDRFRIPAGEVHPIELNCSLLFNNHLIRLSKNLCEEIWIDDLSNLNISYTNENLIFGESKGLLTFTNELPKTLLDSIWWDKDDFETYNFMR